MSRLWLYRVSSSDTKNIWKWCNAAASSHSASHYRHKDVLEAWPTSHNTVGFFWVFFVCVTLKSCVINTTLLLSQTMKFTRQVAKRHPSNLPLEHFLCFWLVICSLTNIIFIKWFAICFLFLFLNNVKRNVHHPFAKGHIFLCKLKIFGFINHTENSLKKLQPEDLFCFSCFFLGENMAKIMSRL